MPAALRAAYLESRQSVAGAEFRAESAAPATFAVRNLGQGLEATLDAHGLRLRHARRADQAALTLHEYGCATAPKVAAPTPPRLGQRANRVEYRRAGVREWYLNGPLGLEHGFTLESDPGCARGSLAFTLTIDGDLRAALIGQGSATRLELRGTADSAAGTEPPLLVYSDLFALDADGKELPSRMLLVGRELRLEVDAAGARYPVTVDPMWTQQTALIASDGEAEDYLGNAVALDGDTAIVGAAVKRVGANNQQGQAYVFVRSGTSWSQQAVLVDAKTGAAGDNFGIAVALSGDTAVIGAFRKNVGVNAQQGQAYVFVRSGTSWSQQDVLKDTVTGAAGDGFGVAVAVSGDTAVIGAPTKRVGTNDEQGQAYIFVRSGTSWALQTVLVDTADGARMDRLGTAVALTGDTAVVGAPWKEVGTPTDQGAVYVHVRSGTTWTQQALLADSATGATFDMFGQSLAISGDTLLIGAYTKKIAANPEQGQVYVYVRSGTAWSQEAILFDSIKGSPTDFFGLSVSLSGDTAVIGAPLKDVGGSARQGQAYVFARSGTTWTQQSIIFDSMLGEAGDNLGFSVAVSGDTAVLGALFKKLGMNARQGQAYVYIGNKSPNGTPCTLGSQCASGFCVDGLCCNSACGGGATADCRSCLGAQTGGSDGTCGTIGQAADYTCRPAATICDQPELCDGRSDSCPADGLYQPADHFLCRAATSCSRDTYCDGTTALCPPSLCIPPRF